MEVRLSSWKYFFGKDAIHVASFLLLLFNNGNQHKRRIENQPKENVFEKTVLVILKTGAAIFSYQTTFYTYAVI